MKITSGVASLRIYAFGLALVFIMLRGLAQALIYAHICIQCTGLSIVMLTPLISAAELDVPCSPIWFVRGKLAEDPVQV